MHLKKGMYLEDEGRFVEAEREFLAADKPREAIEMWVHQQDWDTAQRIADASDPGSLPDIFSAHAKACAPPPSPQPARTRALSCAGAEGGAPAHRVGAGGEGRRGRGSALGVRGAFGCARSV